ncbi:MAG: GNAT family N-acetyltransferase [Candidatus Nomurabacteria bacterium]|jgi:hydroxymethylpyrimidine pyrophosphatase-like HAD family hydrolase/RIO-like serine/threonine protein kinase/RimJ/RimL family protein N-acetyltransferase|nr:GNAT family N-acetyltransferase [Candidatus Nomurabacteria bacterium]
MIDKEPNISSSEAVGEELQDKVDATIIAATSLKKTLLPKRKIEEFTTPEYVPEYIPSPNDRHDQLPKRIRATVDKYLAHVGENPQEEDHSENYEQNVRTAAALLEFFSGKPGKIRRTGSTYRNEQYDNKIIDTMMRAIEQQKPITIFGLSFSPKYRNPNYSNGNLLPDMANYLAMSNLQQIAHGANAIYPQGGVDFVVGYEGKIYQQLGKYSDDDVRKTLETINLLNDQAKMKVANDGSPNRVRVVDTSDLVHECLLNNQSEDSEDFRRTLVRKRRAIREDYETGYETLISELSDEGEDREVVLQRIDNLKQDRILSKTIRGAVQGLEQAKASLLESDEMKGETESKIDSKVKTLSTYAEIEAWKNFWLTTTSPDMFAEGEDPEQYATKTAIGYKAFNEIKYEGGKGGRGILGFSSKILPITVNGTNRKMNFQLVPEWNYYPHHRMTARIMDAKSQRYAWKPISQQEMNDLNTVFVPRFIEGYNYPFYYEQLVPDTDMSSRTSMGASAELLKSEDGGRYIAKTALYANGAEHLLKQISKMQAMREAGIDIIPEIMESNIKEHGIRYLMPYLGDKALDGAMLSENPLSNTEGQFPQLLNGLYGKLWSIGERKTGPTNFSECHMRSVEKGLQAVEQSDDLWLNDNELILVNGRQQFNLKIALDLLKKSNLNLDKVFSASIIPEFTHGDLHLGNIFMDGDNLQLIDINGNTERDNVSIEFELSRLVLSYYRQIIRDGEYSIVTDENGNDNIIYTERGKELLDAREKALESIMQNPNLKEVLTEESLMKIKLLEALDIASVFNKRPDEQKEGTYLIGTSLLNEVIRDGGFADDAILNLMRQKINVDNYRDAEVYSNMETIFQQYLGDRWSGYSISHMFDQFVLSGIAKDGKVESFLTDNNILPDEINRNYTGEESASGERIIKQGNQGLLLAWQQINFPENDPGKLFPSFAIEERAIWDAINSHEPLLVGDQQYSVEGMLGLGKESKVFAAKTPDGKSVAIKIGLQKLDPEFKYAEDLKTRSGEIAHRFPEYLSYDSEKNIIAMELIGGSPAEDVVHSLETPDEWVDFVSNMSGIVSDIATLNERGIFAGQFNLRNVIVDDDGNYRIIDPLFEGSQDVYESKQILRIMGVLVQKIYQTDPGRFPLDVKSANSDIELRNLRYPDGILQTLLEKEINIPEPINSELIKTFTKYLQNGIATKTLEDASSDFRGIRRLCEIYQNPDRAPKFTGIPSALAVDLNGTLEEGGIINAQTVKSINRLSGRGIPVVVISGKNITGIAELLQTNGISPASIDIISDEGAYYVSSGEVVNNITIENVEGLTENIRSYLNNQNILSTVRNNERRINILLPQIDETVLSAISQYAFSQNLNVSLNREVGQIDLTAKGTNKQSGLLAVASRHGIDPNDIVRVGNEPDGNDKEMLFDEDGNRRDNAFMVTNSAETTAIIESLTDTIGYGGKYRSGEMPTQFGSFDDYATATDFEVERLRTSAKTSSNIFYPYSALEKRFDKKDEKTVDYKWILRDSESNPIGFTSINAVGGNGYYNISGIYLTPETRGHGVASKAMTQLKNFASNNITGFQGFRVRIAEANLPSRMLFERSGFVPTEVLEDDYTLIVDGKEQRAKTIVYEYSPTSQVQGINLAQNDVLTGEQLRIVYNEQKELKA